MYHAIKVLREKGFSVREIAKMLSISKTTVQKYLKIPLFEVNKTFLEPARKSILEPFKEKLNEVLINTPKMRASRMHRDFLYDNPNINISERAFRNFINKLKAEIIPKSQRYFSVVDHKPGVMMQVDPGEMYIQNIFNESVKIYFIVFIFCYSKRRYVYYQERPFNTNDFIKAHEACFCYFGYLPKETLYDQTKLVVIEEKYREVWFNQKFYQYITKVGVNPYVCEGYDPQSKGVVENSVKEVKNDFLYGTTFTDIQDIRSKSLIWLEMIDNREHCTLRATPISYFEVEKKCLIPYEYTTYEERNVDKTGLFSWKSNKYSAPYIYQRKKILVKTENEIIQIYDPTTMELVASHKLAIGKVRPIINSNHFRDYTKILEELKEQLLQFIGKYNDSNIFIERLITENSRNPRDQIRAVISFYQKNQDIDWNKIIKDILNFEDIKASKIEKLIMSYRKKEKLNNINLQLKAQKEIRQTDTNKKSIIQRDLSIYDKIGGYNDSKC